MTLGLEILLCLALVSGLYFFAHGLCALSRAVKLRVTWPPVVVLSVGLLGLVHLAGVLTELSVAGVRVAEIVFWLVVASGLKEGGVAAGRWFAQARERSPERLLIPAAGLCYVLFWTLQFKDNISLPSYNDGVAHLSWLVDIQKTGFAYLSKVPVSAADAFGLNLNPFYPTGMQALIASVSGVWMRLGVPATVVLKCWLACAHTAILLSVLWGLKQHWKAIPAWILLIAALTASTAFRFPMDASTEGGLSRIVAMAVVFPLAFYVTSDVGSSIRSLAGLFAIGLLPAFLLHPSAFWMFALAVGFAAAFEWKANRPKAWRGVVALAAGAVFGALQIWLLLKLNRTHTEPLVIPQEYVGVKGLFDKFSDFFKVVLAGTYAPQKAVRVLFHVGLLGMMYLLKAKAISVKVFVFHLGMILFCLFAMATDVYRIPGASLMGGAFYYHPARTACLLVLTVWMVSLSAFPLLLAGWTRVFDAAEKSTGAWKLAAQLKPDFLKPALLVWAFYFAVANAYHLPQVMHDFDSEFQTAQWSRLGGLVPFVSDNTPADALLVAKPYALDVLGAATHRQALFVYGDYVPDRDENSKAKRAWFDGRVDVFERLREAAGGGVRGGEAQRGDRPVVKIPQCRELLRGPLNRTLVFLLNEQAWPALAQMNEANVQALSRTCDGLEVLGQRDGFWVFLLR